jgi:hypothetical protein
MQSLPHAALQFDKVNRTLHVHFDPKDWESAEDRKRALQWMEPVLTWAIGAPMTDQTLYLLQKQVCYKLMEMRDTQVMTKSFIGRGWRVRSPASCDKPRKAEM